MGQMLTSVGYLNLTNERKNNINMKKKTKRNYFVLIVSLNLSIFLLIDYVNINLFLPFLFQTWPFSFQRQDLTPDVENDKDVTWGENPSQNLLRDKNVSYYY